MNNTLAQVAAFHAKYKLPIGKDGDEVSTEERKLRIALLVEEFQEYMQAEADNDRVAIADALGDMVYVIYGTALVYGIPLDECIREIHRSNMTKEGIREDGKVMKGPNFKAPDLETIING